MHVAREFSLALDCASTGPLFGIWFSSLKFWFNSLRNNGQWRSIYYWINNDYLWGNSRLLFCTLEWNANEAEEWTDVFLSFPSLCSSSFASASFSGSSLRQKGGGRSELFIGVRMELKTHFFILPATSIRIPITSRLIFWPQLFARMNPK